MSQLVMSEGDESKKLCITEATEKLNAAYQSYQEAADKCGAAENHRRHVLAELSEAQKLFDSALKVLTDNAPKGCRWNAEKSD